MAIYEVNRRQRIEWYDTDAAGIIYFANYYKMIDSAMLDFFQALPVSMPFREYWGGHGSKGYDWIMLETGCKYFKPITFADIVDVHLWVTKKTNRTLSFTCSFHKDGEEVARGFVITCSTRGLAGEQKAVPPPQEVADAIAVAPWCIDAEPADQRANPPA